MTDGAAKILRARVELRIEEFWSVLRRMPDRERSMLAKGERGQQWPSIVYSAAEHAAWKPVQMRRPPPSAAQISRMHEVNDWMLALAKQERDFATAVWLCCALKKKVKEAGRIMGCHRETARIWRDNGLDRIIAQFPNSTRPVIY